MISQFFNFYRRPYLVFSTADPDIGIGWDGQVFSTGSQTFRACMLDTASYCSQRERKTGTRVHHKSCTI